MQQKFINILNQNITTAFNEKTNFSSVLFTVFMTADLRLLRLFSGNLPAMFTVLWICFILIDFSLPFHSPF